MSMKLKYMGQSKFMSQFDLISQIIMYLCTKLARRKMIIR
jgi:hypothetical protein